MTYKSYFEMRRLCSAGKYIDAAKKLDDCDEKKELLTLFNKWKAQEVDEQEKGTRPSNQEVIFRLESLKQKVLWMNQIANEQLKFK